MASARRWFSRHVKLALALRSVDRRRTHLSKRTYGILAGLIGVSAWWWSRQRATADGARAVDRGTIIFDNTPEPTPLSSEGVI